MTKASVAWLWFLSGAPVGLALIFLPATGRLICFTSFILLETAHSLSPIVLAWTHQQFRRQVILPQLGKFLLLPGLLALAAVTVGVITEVGLTSYQPGKGAYLQITGWSNPFPVLVWVYFCWNLYHFAMQDFGVLVMCSGGANRAIKRIGCLTAYLGVYFLVDGLNAFGFWRAPGLGQAIWWLNPLVLMGMSSVNHWIVDIGLSTAVAGWWFPLAVLTAGVIGLAWAAPTSQGNMVRIIPVIIGARLGLGMIHFLYSRWVWQLSDPRVRATIGKALVS